MSTCTSSYRRAAVLGAGFAGLAAANRLADAGLEVAVFEARDRVGGRVWSQSLDVGERACVVERGAEFVLDGYDTFRTLAENLQLELIDSGMSYYIRELAETPHVATDVIADSGQRAARLARELGHAVSVDEVLSMLALPDEIDQALRARIEISSAAPAARVAAAALDQIASFEPLPSYRVAGGNQRLAIELARRLGSAVRLRDGVTAVEPDQTGVRITTQTGEAEFDHVVVALPLGVVLNGDVRMPSSDARLSAMRRLTQGHAAKLHAPLAATAPTSAVLSVPGRFWTWTAVDAEGTVAPVMTSFAGSASSLAALEVDDGPNRWFDAARTIRPDLDFSDQEPLLTTWTDDPFAGGAYAARSPSFTDTDQLALEAPIGRIHFAGEYADAAFTGLMEGALRSGLRAADSILASVQDQRRPRDM